MTELTRIANRPWNFTLYASTEGLTIMKVMFSEGDYKTDVGRFFTRDPSELGDGTAETLKSLAAMIREEYPNRSHSEIGRTAVTVLGDSGIGGSGS